MFIHEFKTNYQNEKDKRRHDRRNGRSTMAQAQKVVDEKEPQPIETPITATATTNSYKGEMYVNDNPFANGNYHPKRTRKSNPLSLGSYKQKRK